MIPDRAKICGESDPGAAVKSVRMRTAEDGVVLPDLLTVGSMEARWVAGPHGDLWAVSEWYSEWAERRLPTSGS